MAGYVINIGNASAKQWASIVHEFALNRMSSAMISLDGVDSAYAAEFDVGNAVSIYKDGVQRFKGEVLSQDSMSGGGIILSCAGEEIELCDSKSPMVGNDTVRTWSATSDNTIFSTLITSVSGWTVDVTNSTSADVDFRTSASESVWNAAQRLALDSGKDIWIDQENKKAYLYDEYTRASQFSFVEGANAFGIMRKKQRSQAGKVIVYGKGDGDNQIIASSGTGTPVHVVIDRNIVTAAEAATRAAAEYARLNPQLQSYSFMPLSSVDSLRVGDSGNIMNNSANISAEVDIVRIKVTTTFTGGESAEIEVTNPEFRTASKNLAEHITKSNVQNTIANTAMQGSGNINTWGNGINAKTNYPLKIGFYLSEEQIQDEAGNLRVNSLTVDYDIDPYNNQFGSATFTGSDPQVQNDSGGKGASVSGNSGNAQPYIASGSSSNYNPYITTGDSSAINSYTTVGSVDWATTSCSSGSWTTVATIAPGSSYLNKTLIAEVGIMGSSGGAEDIEIRLRNSRLSGYIEPGVTGGGMTVWGLYSDGFRDTSMIRSGGISAGGVTSSTDTIYLQVRPQTGAIDLTCGLWLSTISHQHGAGNYRAELHPHGVGNYRVDNHPHDQGNYAAASHEHPDGSYDINAADLNYISIGDGVGEAGSVNATSVNLYLDFWNGSSWVNKHSVLNTGAAIGNSVDMTNSGTYPDAAGFWRVRVEPITASADFVQGIVRLRSAIDN